MTYQDKAEAILATVAETRRMMEPLHDLAWEAPNPARTIEVATQLLPLLKKLDQTCATEVLQRAHSEITSSSVPTSVAALLFEVLDPLLAFCVAAAEEAAGRPEPASKAAWYCADGVLISLGSAIAGFEFVEPWAHEKTEKTADFLRRLEQAAIKKGVERHRFLAVAEAAQQCETRCLARPEVQVSAGTGPKDRIAQLTELLANSAALLHSLRPEATGFAAWRNFPPRVVSVLTNRMGEI